MVDPVGALRRPEEGIIIIRIIYWLILVYPGAAPSFSLVGRGVGWLFR